MSHTPTYIHGTYHHDTTVAAEMVISCLLGSQPSIPNPPPHTKKHLSPSDRKPIYGWSFLHGSLSLSLLRQQRWSIFKSTIAIMYLINSVKRCRHKHTHHLLWCVHNTGVHSVAINSGPKRGFDKSLFMMMAWGPISCPISQTTTCMYQTLTSPYTMYTPLPITNITTQM